MVGRISEGEETEYRGAPLSLGVSRTTKTKALMVEMGRTVDLDLCFHRGGGQCGHCGVFRGVLGQ